MSDLQDIIAHNAQRAYDQGVTRERERWESRLNRIRTWNPESHQAFIDGVMKEQERIVKIIQDRIDYECRCRCKCHSETPPCHACLVDGELIDIIRGDSNGTD